MPRAYIGLGSNLGDRAALIQQAVEALAATPGMRVAARSRVRETAPVGRPQPRFLNAVVAVETSLPPTELLQRLKQVEDRLGRERVVRWGPRTIDLDLLLYDDLALDTPELTLPHPQIVLRRFVLEPLAELAPDLRHPTLGRTMRELLAAMPEEEPLAKRWYIALAGPIGAGKTTLARVLAARLDAEFLCEPASHNPLLGAFYADMAANALTTQLFFLLERAGQLRRWRERPDIAIAVSDYVFDKHALFADLVLRGPEREVHDAVADLATPGLPTPDVVVFLNAPLDTLAARVAQRGRPEEKALSREYLARVADAYTRFFGAEHPWPVIDLSHDAADYAGDSDRMDWLLVRIAAACGNRD